MDQGSTQTCANQGKSWTQIVGIAYENTAWKYLSNIALNPSFETSDLFNWNGGPTRTCNSGAWEGGCYATELANSNLIQTQPFLGPSTNNYAWYGALRCSADYADSCFGALKIRAVCESGVVKIREIQGGVHVPNDGQWHIYDWQTTLTFGCPITRVGWQLGTGSRKLDVDDTILAWAP